MTVHSRQPRPGQVVILDRTASIQFDGDRAITVRILEVDDRSTYDDWVWLTVSVLGPAAARRRAAVRTVFVQRAGLRPAPDTSLLGMPERGGVIPAQRTEPVSKLRR
jgi:hypothetical protein